MLQSVWLTIRLSISNSFDQYPLRYPTIMFEQLSLHTFGPTHLLMQCDNTKPFNSNNNKKIRIKEVFQFFSFSVFLPLPFLLRFSSALKNWIVGKTLKNFELFLCETLFSPFDNVLSGKLLTISHQVSNEKLPLTFDFEITRSLIFRP